MLDLRDIILIISALEDSKKRVESNKALDARTRKEFVADLDGVIEHVKDLRKTGLE